AAPARHRRARDRRRALALRRHRGAEPRHRRPASGRRIPQRDPWQLSRRARRSWRRGGPACRRRAGRAHARWHARGPAADGTRLGGKHDPRRGARVAGAHAAPSRASPAGVRSARETDPEARHGFAGARPSVGGLGAISGPPSRKMSWQSEMDELRRREGMAEELGGPERVKRQHAGGRMTIRERIAKLVDPGTFHEVGKIAGKATYDATNDLETFTPSNFVFGRAKVDGRPVVVGGDDFTVRGGSADATIKDKHLQCELMANELRLPLIRLGEGSGGGGSGKTIETTRRANDPGRSGWETVVANIGPVPRVALGLGSVAGLGAAHLAAAHYSVMVKEISALFVAGPPVVERLGQKLSKNELGGWEIQLKAGAVDDAVDTEEE